MNAIVLCGGGKQGAPSVGSGGTGGGGAAQSGAGTVNTGSGGGGNGNASAAGAGGSGVVILRYPNTKTIANSGGGLTISTATVGSEKISTITAGTGNVTWS